MELKKDVYESLLRSHVSENAYKTLKQPNSYLKYPFVDPGSVYAGNLWDWDSFWAVYALLNLVEGSSGEYVPVNFDKDLVIQHAKGNIYNFFDNQLEDGYIPMMMEKTNLSEPYLNGKHKEGYITNMHKPFLCMQILMICEYTKDYSWIEPFDENIVSYFHCYDNYYFNSNCGLYVWADDIMIGMDNDPATFGRPRFSTANIFLNGFMVSELRAAAQIMEQLGKKEKAAEFNDKRSQLIKNIQSECWDPRDQFFYSVDVDVKTRQFDWFHKGLGVFWKTLPIKIRVWSGFLPLWAGFATQEQANALVKHAFDEGTFSSPFGVTTLAKDEKMFNLEATSNPSNWLGPIWLVSNYVVFRGLMNYGFVKEAEDLCWKTLRLLGQDLENTGTLHEYYDPFTGLPVMNGGFLNWNLLAVNMLDELKGKEPILKILYSPE